MTSPPANDADLHGLAAAVAGTSWLDAPAEVRDQVVDLVADCVAVTALGSARPELRRLAAVHDRLTPTGAFHVEPNLACKNFRCQQSPLLRIGIHK